MEKMNLHGLWQVCLAAGGLEKTDLSAMEHFKDEIELPGTTETRGLKGNQDRYTGTLYLARKRGYTGKAYYAKQITVSKEMEQGFVLCLERTKYTRIFIDGACKSSSHDTLTPQMHVITGVTAGVHLLVIEVDNDLESKEDFPKALINGHQYTEHTQTNWNGILGEMTITPLPCVWIKELTLYKNQLQKQTGLLQLESKSKGSYLVKISLTPLSQETMGEERKAFSFNGPWTTEFEMEVEEGTTHKAIELDSYALEAEKFTLWNEFTPNTYQVSVSIWEPQSHTCIDEKQSFFGVTYLEAREKFLYARERRIFLRGNVDCAIFPLTGHAPTTEEEWGNLFEKMKNYGLNHYRYHSWCPQEAAFKAADRCGMYLQVELAGFGVPFYTKEHPNYDGVLEAYYEDQALKVLTTYGNHPSFAIFAIGNELTGEVKAYEPLLRKLKAKRPDILFTQGANNFLEDPVCSLEDQLWITMRTAPLKNIRSSFSHADLPLGFIQTKEEIGTQEDYQEPLSQANIPVIAHETGQFQCMPNLEEASKYTGVLESNVFERYKKDLTEKGLLPLAKDFFRASGKLAVQLYKEDIESNLRTPDSSGFQLLGLQDFPGQGTALVGVLDSFLEDKGLVSPEEWRQFCAPEVLLAKFPAYVYEEGEDFPLEILFYHYGKCEKAAPVTVNLLSKTTETQVVMQKIFPPKIYDAGGLHTVGQTTFTMPKVTKGETFTLQLQMGELQNTYPIWVYPKKTMYSQKVRILHRLTKEDDAWIEEGGIALLLKDESKPFIEGFFPTDFWCYPMFKEGCLQKNLPIAPGTMGLLIEKEHPIFEHFPTESYSQWQWQKIIATSHSYFLPKEAKPIVRVIDHFSRNHELAFLWEEKRGNGKLMVCGADLVAMQTHPGANALLTSILAYLAI